MIINDIFKVTQNKDRNVLTKDRVTKLDQPLSQPEYEQINPI
jgi:hypothetical protein